MGSKNFFRLAARFFTTRFFVNETVVLLLHEKNTHQVSPAEIVRANDINSADMLAFQDNYHFQLFQKCLSKGDMGYLGYMNGKCIHRSLVTPGPAKVLVHKFIPKTIGPDEAFIHYCETAPEVRGKNVFTHVLCRIADDMQGKKNWIVASGKNDSSLRSMEKAGFVKKEKKRIVVILGIKWTQTLVP